MRIVRAQALPHFQKIIARGFSRSGQATRHEQIAHRAHTPLAITLRRHTSAVFQRIKERGIAVLLVEQYLEFAWRLAGSYAIMRKGAIVSRGSTSELRHDVVRQHLTV